MNVIAATVSELIESLQQYPGDWPVMIPNQGMYDYRSALHGIYIYEGGATTSKTIFTIFTSAALYRTIPPQSRLCCSVTGRGAES